MQARGRAGDRLAASALRTPLSILYRDERVVFVDKPAGLLVHKVAGGSDDAALLQRLRDQLGQHVHPVHRLDQMASGVLVYGLDRAAARALQQSLQNQAARKEYLVLVRGVAPRSFRCDQELRDDKGSLRAACTTFERLELFPGRRFSLLLARLHSGRYHQIRRHLALCGRHVLADRRYGNARANRHAYSLGLRRIFLHAQSLEVDHPDGPSLRVMAPLAPDLQELLKRLRRESWRGTSPCNLPPEKLSQARMDDSH